MRAIQPHYLILIATIIAIGLITHIPRRNAKTIISRAYKQIRHSLPRKKEHPGDASAELVLKGSDFYFFEEKNMKLCRVRAAESHIFSNEKKSECRDIVCRIETNKKESASLSAPVALLDHKNEVITFRGGVISSLEVAKPPAKVE